MGMKEEEKVNIKYYYSYYFNEEQLQYLSCEGRKIKCNSSRQHKEQNMLHLKCIISGFIAQRFFWIF